MKWVLRGVQVFLHLTSWKDAISRIMHSPMSFFETTVRIVESAEFTSH